MNKCDVCEREFKNPQGLSGHMRFVHGIKSSKQASLSPPKRFITDEELEKALLYFRDEVNKQKRLNLAILRNMEVLAANAAANQPQISESLRQKLHESDMELNKAIEGSASRGNFMDEYNGILEVAKALGLSHP